MKWPLVTRKRYEADTAGWNEYTDKLQAELNERRDQVAHWRVEYSKIRDWIVDTNAAVFEMDTSDRLFGPKIKALFASAAGLFKSVGL